jgi:hypothetical protein
VITDDHRRTSALHSKAYGIGIRPDGTQEALCEDVTWIPQPAFDKAFADLTGTQPEDDEWRRETRWNFTADDQSFT